MWRYLLLSAALLVPAPAFAKNVFAQNHPDLDWYSIETEHFVVHYPQSRTVEGNEHYLTAKWTAQRSAKIAEEMFPRMCKEFNYYLKERVHIVILNQGDDLEGFTVPSWDWIEISANPGADFYRWRSRMDWLPDVLVHEFAHVVSLKANSALAEGAFGVLVGGLYNEGVGNSMTGASMMIGNNEPWYWTEGGAEYWSDQSGYNWWTPARDRTIRMSVLEERLLSWDEWKTVQQQHGWWDGERGYQQGYSFGLYLRQRFGNETYNQLALENQKGFTFDWNDHLLTVTGVSGPQLYEDWRAFVTESYTARYDALRAEGETAHREFALAQYDWEYTDPAGRDAFYDPRWARKTGVTGELLARRAREVAKEATGRWQMNPKFSDDGKWFGVNNGGQFEINPLGEASIAALSGVVHGDAGVSDRVARQSAAFYAPGSFGHDWDFVPGQAAVVLVASEHFEQDAKDTLFQARPEIDGYDWKNLWVLPLELPEHREGNLTYKGVKLVNELGVKHPPFPKGGYKIPNTARGVDPSVSPDGKKVAYFEYTDGNHNLVTINLDGSEKKVLTNFHDGTWMQRVDWSPDGKTLALAMFRQFQQDIYLMNADGTDVRALTFDRWEDNDPEFTRDGDLLFASDRSGIMQVYRWDHRAGTVAQLTNTIGGAEAPAEAPSGAVVYLAYHANGNKVEGILPADFLEKDVSADFVLNADPTAVKAAWEFREDLSMYTSKPYKSPIMSPGGAPMIRITNDSRDDLSLQAGAVFFLNDYVEDHFVYSEAMVGEDWLARVQYAYSGWYPTLSLGVLAGEFKIPFGYLLDDDGDLSTTGDQGIFEGKNQQYIGYLFTGVDFPWNPHWNSSLFGVGRTFGFRQTGDANYAPYSVGGEATFTQTYSSYGTTYTTSANVRGGRVVDLSYGLGYSDIIYEAYGGRSVDDGELLDAYTFHKVELRWVEQIPVPAWGGILTEANKYRHTIQIDFNAGLVDRNVDRNDEFIGGGQHPFDWGSNSLRPNTLFAGYPAYSVSGETMAMVNLAYRFPIRRELNAHIGPLYVYDVTAQIMGTAGNIWSFTPPEDAASFYRNEFGERVAKDPADVRREIPFVDIAHKNGNYLLYDAGAEVRVTSTLLDSVGWNSFLRVTYGFNRLHGYGDVDGDDVSDTTESAVGDELSNEVEEPGFRFYVGLGTGW